MSFGFQFIVGQEGEFGIAYEHSPAEGPPIANILDHISSYAQRTKETLLPSADINPPIRLKFDLSQETLDDIDTASRDFDAWVTFFTPCGIIPPPPLTYPILFL